MNEDVIADIWHVIAEHAPDKVKDDAAGQFIDVLLDHGVSQNVLEGLMGVDSFLDAAIEYAIDDVDSDDIYEDEDYD
jgi:hypothetical protein